MYSAISYRSDLKKAWKPVEKAGAAFGKSLGTLDPFKYAGHCLLAVTVFCGFILVLVILTGRKLFNT